MDEEDKNWVLIGPGGVWTDEDDQPVFFAELEAKRLAISGGPCPELLPGDWAAARWARNLKTAYGLCQCDAE